MAQIATITTATDAVRKPDYPVARTIVGIDRLNFYRNSQLHVRVTRRNGRAVGYEQLVRWETTDFTAFNGTPGRFLSEVPSLAEALTGQAHHRYVDVTMHFEGHRFSEWDQADTQVLVVAAWERMDATQVAAYKAIRVHHAAAARRDREARRLERQARRLRQQH